MGKSARAALPCCILSHPLPQFQESPVEFGKGGSVLSAGADPPEASFIFLAGSLGQGLWVCEEGSLADPQKQRVSLEWELGCRPELCLR